MNYTKYMFLPIMAVLLFLTGCTNSSNQNLYQVYNSGTVLADSPLYYNWEDINIRGGDVSHVFMVTNSGEDDLVLKGGLTSCMCTTAVIELPDGDRSPEFGMHNNPRWARAVAPGGSFQVKVTFDPMAHGPKATGPISRVFYLETSAPIDNKIAKPSKSSANDSMVEFRVSANVLSEDDFTKRYPDGKLVTDHQYDVQMGDFAFTEDSFDFGKIKQSGGIVSHEFPFQYNGDKPISITAVVGSCICTVGEVDKENYSPGDQGVLTVNFDPNVHGEPEGKFFKSVVIMTDPPSSENIEVKIWTAIDLDLGEEAFKLNQESDDEVVEEEYQDLSIDSFETLRTTEDVFLLDVHIPEQDHIDGTDAFIPFNEIFAGREALPTDKETTIVVYCRSGGMSPTAVHSLEEMGYTNVYNLLGGKNAFDDLQ